MNNLQKLHLGCGDISLTGWLNIDLDTPTADMNLDFTAPLPFANQSASHIFSEHFIEHVTRGQAVDFLRECHRLLVADGVIRVTTPSLRFLVNAYIADNTSEWGHLWQPDSRCLLINEGMRSWGHQFIYDAEEFARIFVEAGFTLIKFHDYRVSEDQVLSGLESRPFHNELIVEARKSDDAVVQIDNDAITRNELQWKKQLETIAVERSQSGESDAHRYLRDLKATQEALRLRTEHLAGLQGTIEDQTRHILALEHDRAEREQQVIKSTQHTADLMNHIKSIEAEIEARSGQLDQAQRIVEQQRSNMEAQDLRLKDAFSQHQTEREQFERSISVKEEVIMKFRHSLCGKVMAFFGGI